MTLDSSRWNQVKAAFAELVELPDDVRAARLEQLSGGDPAVGAEVAALLAAAEGVGERFEQGPAFAASAASSPLVGRRLGPWQVVREIGRGGMGTVYEAQRVDDQYTQRAALKTVGDGRESESVLRRFRHERQILARLQHANIAALLDGGVTPEGQPYFVMEYVEGLPIDKWCKQHRPGVRRRVDLFQQVCAAVQYAHEQLVVHRDLKPGNILVTPEGVVKLLDFGIAKLLDPTQSDAAALTVTGALPMTAVYASPEQRQGLPVAAASDTYSLGVVLYELLSGTRPFDAASLQNGDRLPIPPSRAVSGAAADSTAETSPRKLQRALAGELDSIVLMALRPEADRRYRAVQFLSDDLERYLDGLPVRAQSDALGYRFGKFLRRNRATVAAASLAVAALLAGSGFSLHQASVAQAERDSALREKHRTEQVTAFFQEVFASAKPQRAGRDITVVAAIDSAVGRTDSSFIGEPDLRAAIKLTLGSTLTDMYLYERARPLLEDAYRIRRELDGAGESREQSDALYYLAGIEAEIGSPTRAESLYRKSLGILGRLPPVDSANIYRGLGNVAGTIMSQGRLADAAALYDTVARAVARLLPDDRVLQAIALTNRGTALTQIGRYVEAEPALRQAVTLFERSRGPHDPRVASALQPLSGNLAFQGKYAEAEAVARRSADIYEHALGPTSAATLSSLRMLTAALVDDGRCGEAMPLLRRMLALRGHELVDADPTIGAVLLQTGQCQAAAGDLRGSAASLRDALAVRTANLGARHWAVAQTESVLGDVLARAGDGAEAERLLKEGYEGLKRELAPGHVRITQARARLERYYRATGRIDLAVALS